MAALPHTQEPIQDFYTSLFQSLHAIGTAYYKLGKLDAGIKLLNEGIAMLDGQEVKPQDALKVLLLSGKLQTRKSFTSNTGHDLSLQTGLRARQIAEANNDEQGLADALQLIGDTYYYKKMWTDEGDYQQALEYYQDALHRREALADHRGVSESLLFIGLIHERQEQYDQAFAYYTRAYQVAEQHDHDLEKSYAARHLAGIYLEQRSDLEQAGHYFAESLALREGYKTLLPLSLLAVGEVESAKGNLTSALSLYEQALALAQEMGQQTDIMFTLIDLGELHQKQEEIEQARAYYKQALTQAQAINLTLGITIVSGLLAGLDK
ncbi:MAG TPA: tetratricopeptide repeat protein [Ktedonosporobacter sp.]|nr:tetratricopeptide repeat protein [Ktedonosporobacter sp.]